MLENFTTQTRVKELFDSMWLTDNIIVASLIQRTKDIVNVNALGSPASYLWLDANEITPMFVSKPSSAILTNPLLTELISSLQKGNLCQKAV